MITVMVPALNEEKRLRGTIEKLILASKKAGNILLDIVIINDGSTDGTGKIIQSLIKKYRFCRSIHHEKNKGIGIGLQETLKIAKYPKFMIIPADDVVALSLITKLFMNRNKADLVVSYFLNKEIRSTKRNVLSDLYGLIYMSTFHVYVQYINSVNLYPTEKLKSIQIHSSRFSMAAEITIKLLRMGCSLYELSGSYLIEGMVGSKSFTFQNLLEVMQIYILMIYEIYIEKKHIFNKFPVRITDEKDDDKK